MIEGIVSQEEKQMMKFGEHLKTRKVAPHDSLLTTHGNTQAQMIFKILQIEQMQTHSSQLTTHENDEIMMNTQYRTAEKVGTHHSPLTIK